MKSKQNSIKKGKLNNQNQKEVISNFTQNNASSDYNNSSYYSNDTKNGDVEFKN